MTNVNLLKSVMAMQGETSFVTCIMKLLGVSRSTASRKLNGKADFTQSEIARIAEYYKLTAENIKEIFVGE